MTQPIVPIQVPLTQGAIRSFGHLQIQAAGLELNGGLKGFKRSRKRDREFPMSNNPDPVGKTLGENKYQASVILYYDWFMNMLLTLQNTFGPGYGDQSFTAYATYVGVNLVVYTDMLLNCTLDSTDADDVQGIGALTRPIELNPTKILFGGYDDLAVPLVNII